jgi:hypothetical protein
MFTIYLYLVLMAIIMIILYITQDQIILANKERRYRLENATFPAVKCNNYYFSPSLDQTNYLNS